MDGGRGSSFSVELEKVDGKESLEALQERGRKYFKSARCPLHNVTYIRTVNVVRTRHKQRFGHGV